MQIQIMGKKQRLLAESFLFNGLPPEDLAQLAAICVEKRCSKGEDIFYEGYQADGFYMLTAGKLVVVNGQEVTTFEYAGPTMLTVQIGRFSPDASLVEDKPMDWGGTPHIYKAVRLLVIYVGDDPATLELLTKLLGEQIRGG